MTKTKLIKKILQKLKVLESGESPDSDQTSTVNEMYDLVYQELKSDEVVTWTESGEVPEKQAGQMIILMASRLVDEFSVPEPRASRLVLQGDIAHDRLYSLNSVPYVPTTDAVSY